MGLDMYAFSLARSAEFSKPGDILNYRVPEVGKDLPSGAIPIGLIPDMEAALERALNGFVGPYPNLDVGAEFVDSKYVLPGSTLLHRWRKHPNLHGWMQRRWNVLRAGKLPKEFDVKARVPLNVQDLKALEIAVVNRQLPPTKGYNFGKSDSTERADDLAFIDAARREIAAGNFVYYTSWW